MATFFGSPPFVSHPIVRTQHLSSSSQPPPPPSPPPQPPSQSPPLGKVSLEQLVVGSDKVQRQNTSKNAAADSTDWIALSLTRRFGLGAGLAWAGFLAFGVLSEQIKTRFEVNQQEANTRFVMQQKLEETNDTWVGASNGCI